MSLQNRQPCARREAEVRACEPCSSQRLQDGRTNRKGEPEAWVNVVADRVSGICNGFKPCAVANQPALTTSYPSLAQEREGQ